MQTLTYCDAKITSTRTAVGQFKGQFNGAMEEMRQKVQNASTHMLRCQNHDCACNRRSVQGAVQRGDGGHVREGFKMQTLTSCKTKITSTRTTAGQFKGQFNGANTYILRGPKSRASAQQSVSSRVSSMGRWNVTHGFDSRETGGNVAEGSKGEHSAQKQILL